MFARPIKPLHAIPLYALAVVGFVLTVVLRYNAPEGSFGGLTDDHFYFVTQGWQMLFGEWPDRDYFEPGAPLTLAISAGLQTALGRSVWSEYVFCVVALGAGAAVTFVLATRASGSILLGLLALVFQFALLPRLYGYPKIIVYAAAIAAMWSWASAPGTRRTCLVAAITAVAFLLRHDHGVYVGVGFFALLCTIRGAALGERVKQAFIYGLATALFLAPYLIYLQLNGGIDRHFIATYAWAARDYLRSPRVLPSFEWVPLVQEVATDAPASEWWEHAPWAVLAEHSTFWLFWLFIALPAVAALLLAVRPGGRSPEWKEETAKISVVIVLAALVDYGFLRGNIAGRLADVSVPMAILSAWILGRAGRIVVSGRAEVLGRQRPVGSLGRAIAMGAVVVPVVITALVLVRPFVAALQNGRATEGLASMRSGVENVTVRLQHTWPLDGWAGEDRADLLLARYLQACTAPADRVLVTEFRPQIAGLAQRGFAAGHVDLRGGGFFGSTSEQELTVARWRTQSVPVVFGPTREDYPQWSRDLPIVERYLNREYRNLGEKDVGGFRFLLFTRRSARVVRSFPALAFPCFR